MSKQKKKMDGFIKALDEAGIPYKFVDVKLECSKDLEKFLREVEEAHKRTKNSKLRFGRCVAHA